MKNASKLTHFVGVFVVFWWIASTFSIIIIYIAENIVRSVWKGMKKIWWSIFEENYGKNYYFSENTFFTRFVRRRIWKYNVFFTIFRSIQLSKFMFFLPVCPEVSSKWKILVIEYSIQNKLKKKRKIWHKF